MDHEAVYLVRLPQPVGGLPEDLTGDEEEKRYELRSPYIRRVNADVFRHIPEPETGNLIDIEQLDPRWIKVLHRRSTQDTGISFENGSFIFDRPTPDMQVTTFKVSMLFHTYAIGDMEDGVFVATHLLLRRPHYSTLLEQQKTS